MQQAEIEGDIVRLFLRKSETLVLMRYPTDPQGKIGGDFVFFSR